MPRMPSTAAWSAPFLSFRPRYLLARSAATSVTRTILSDMSLWISSILLMPPLFYYIQPAILCKTCRAGSLYLSIDESDWARTAK